MIPVLAVNDLVAARLLLENQLGFRRAASGHMVFGDAEVAVVAADALPVGMTALPFDHIAFRVPDADRCHRRGLASGAAPDVRFTPDGPRDIPDFWRQGVRFVFFQGPDGAPFEFCAQNDATVAQSEGHSHFAIRTQDPDAVATRLAALGATEIARHVLAGAEGPVLVRFLQAGAHVFELFDEAPFAMEAAATGWVGLLPGDGTT